MSRLIKRAWESPSIPITAKTGENIEELLHVAHRQMHIGYTIEPDDLYDDYTHEIHHRIDSASFTIKAYDAENSCALGVY